ncbi:tetratricopeptide repeat protein [Polyangium sp. 15x6]|uniref:tetratricopeptide repeat protein n=1 Tax=Polyangium sp. 15x6 TaxID=3042687 RepID=UPI00249C3E0E|nr:tetratricopeptide repeat protein [Polyangium sp. 15x6]MDI3283109.1 tetratricopeptide repeat protein [Polyangium sp. 15x6]
MNGTRGFRTRKALLAGLVAAFAALAPSLAHAIDPEQAITGASQQITIASNGLRAIEDAVQKSKGRGRTPAQRIADAVLLVGSKDWERAATLLNEIIEKYPDHPTAYPDALSLLGETYFQSRQYLSARRVYFKITDRTQEPRFLSYQSKALERLVDIALRTKDYRHLDDVFAAMNRLPPAAVTSGISYARGKGLVVKKDWAGAKAALASVDPKSEYAHQAGYLLGVVAMKEATPPPVPLAEGEVPPRAPRSRYVAAIDQFRKVTQLPPDSKDHERVIDMAWLAIGRLFYESDQWAQAVDAYNHIDRSSPEFGTMLYELGWVYVRLGDVERAQRALEVLSVADPNSQNIADGSLLRADLMLRAGQFEKSLKVYEGVRANYDPMRARVDAFLGSTSDPAVYYDKLSQEQLDVLDSSSGLPTLAIQWAREAEDGPAAFAVIEGIAQCRELIQQSNDLIEKLNAVVASTNRVRAFPELKAGEEKALGLINRVGLARLSIGQGMDEVESSALSGEIGQVRARRRSLEKRLGLIPVNDSDFQEREGQALKQWNGASQSVQRMTLEVDSLQAQVNGLRRMLREAPQAGVVRDPAAVARFEQELAAHERDLAIYRKHIADLRKLVGAGKMQVGFGDQRFIEDAQVRQAYREAIVREVQLAMAGQGGASLAAYAKRVAPLLQKGDETDAKVFAALSELEREVARRTTDVRAILARETAAVVGYEVELERLDKEARGVVGEVAMRNFGLVRDRLRSIVLRADVGITEEAWEVREEQMTRVRSLRVERAREEKLLREELDEVLDDSGAPETEGK